MKTSIFSNLGTEIEPLEIISGSVWNWRTVELVRFDYGLDFDYNGTMTFNLMATIELT